MKCRRADRRMAMKLKGWKEIPPGGIIPEGGTSVQYETGGWRAYRPKLDREKCNNCLLCWMFCPDSAILTQGGKLVDFDWKHCKGCGVCSEVCPISAITMIEEASVEV
jgi:pyruvate ferredoxin oxidoreductase delta subunit